MSPLVEMSPPFLLGTNVPRANAPLYVTRDLLKSLQLNVKMAYFFIITPIDTCTVNGFTSLLPTSMNENISVIYSACTCACLNDVKSQ